MGKNIAIILVLILTSCNGISQDQKKELAKAEKGKVTYPVTKTDAEWRAELTDMEYYVLRKAATEN